MNVNPTAPGFARLVYGHATFVGDWATVTAALLCLHDHDDARGADLGAVEAHTLREEIRKQLGWSAYGNRVTVSPESDIDQATRQPGVKS